MIDSIRRIPVAAALLAFTSLATVCWVLLGSPNLPKKRVRGPRGLANYGRACYMNSVLQALASSSIIENWLSKSSDRHLVVSKNLVLGFEHKIVINLADPAECSRSSGHVITTGQMYTNYDHMALPMFDFLERSDHDCRDLQHAGMETPLNVIGKISFVFHNLKRNQDFKYLIR